MLLEECSESGAMAMTFVLAVAADREVSIQRQEREQSEDPDRRRFLHLLRVALHEPSPVLWSIWKCLEPPQERNAGGKFRQPGIIEIKGSIAVFRDTPRWPPHGPDANAFLLVSGAAELYDSNWPVLSMVDSDDLRDPPL
jgi:hypothetical protein